MRVFRTAILIAATVFASGCTGDATGSDNISGRYTLQSLDGVGMPAIVDEEPGYRFEVTGGDVQLNSDETYSTVIRLRETLGGSVTTNASTDVGVFVRNGNAVALTSTLNSSVRQGSISGNTLTVIDGKYIYVFQK